MIPSVMDDILSSWDANKSGEKPSLVIVVPTGQVRRLSAPKSKTRRVETDLLSLLPSLVNPLFPLSCYNRTQLELPCRSRGSETSTPSHRSTTSSSSRTTLTELSNFTTLRSKEPLLRSESLDSSPSIPMDESSICLLSLR